MVRGRHYRQTVFLLQIFILGLSSFAQKGGQSAANPQAAQANQSQGGAGQGLQGFSFAPEEWPQLTLPDVTNPVRTVRGRTVLCYKLTKANSPTQPFILQRINLPNEVVGTGFDRPCGNKGAGETDREGRKACEKNGQKYYGHWNVCSPLDETHPLLMGQEVVIGIDISDLRASGVNINQIKLLNINVTTQQSTPINPSPIRPSFPGTAAGGATTSQGSAGEAEQSSAQGGWWTPLLGRPAGWDGKSTWEARKEYNKGEVVADWSLTRFFRANKDCFNSGPALIDPFPREQNSSWIQDGSVIWQEMSKLDDRIGHKVEIWKSGKEYKTGEIVKVGRGPEGPKREEQLEVLKSQGATFMDLPLGQIPGGSYERLKAVPSADCGSSASKTKEDIWHYYWAFKGGRSGLPPHDPFSIVLLPRVIYLPWPYQLPGDVIPNVTINLVYSPPVPGGQWQGNTFYPAGSVVTSSANTGHYYTAITGGFSSPEPHEPDFPIDAPPTARDGDLVWLDSGTSAPSVSAASSQSGGGGPQGGGASTGKSQQWLPKSHYLIGDVIFDTYNGHYYTMVSSKGGTSGMNPPFQTLPVVTTLHDGDLLWIKTDAQPKSDWNPDTHYKIDDVVSIDMYRYKVIGSTATAGTTSADEHLLPHPGSTLPDGDVIWQDFGQDTTHAQPRSKNTTYSFGQAVSDNGKLYVMVGTRAGNSGSNKPKLPNGSGQPTLVSDNDLLWMATGVTCTSPQWVAMRSYVLDDKVCSSDRQQYKLIRYIAGTSGPPPQPTFPIFEPRTVIEPKSEIAETHGGPAIWEDSGVIRPVGTPPGNRSWSPEIQYNPGDVVHVEGPGNGRYYTALSASVGVDPRSSPTSFLNFPIGYPKLPLTWQDIGTTPPATVVAGQPPDQTVSLLNVPLPQTHSLSYFNIASGFVVSFKRSSTFGFVSANNVKLPNGFVPATTGPTNSNLAVDPGTGCTISTIKNTNGTTPVFFCPAKTGHGPYGTDPILGLTFYYPPIDAELPYRWSNAKNWIPGASVAFSLTNPTSNFFVGGSNEFLIRNVQLSYGLAFLKGPVGLGAPSSQPVFGGTGAAPSVVTQQGFQKTIFTGFTLNLSGFIQSLGFGGSKPQGQ